LDGDFAGRITTGQEQRIGLHEHIPNQITNGNDCPLTHDFSSRRMYGQSIPDGTDDGLPHG
jgi:hypothetical protein